MEMKRFEAVAAELEQALAELEIAHQSPAERLRQVTALVDKAMSGVQKQVLAGDFTSAAEEILFFKIIKPRIYAIRLYEHLLYRFLTNRPQGTEDMIRQYDQAELLATIRELQADSFHYQYYKSGASQLDSLYFLRGASGGDIPVIVLNEAIPGFSTPLDFTFARFIAYEHFQEHILGLMAGNYSVPMVMAGQPAKDLRWTGESINLVELAYGIWLTGQVNHGNASVSQIVEWLEVNLQVNIGLAFRRWSAISHRKRISVTKFIDQMKAAILKRLDDENGLR